ncbi:MAG: aminotransferase class I/II-fold pyridoxal phosphate-dependent enzyme [Desulfovibrio sp.]|jgi:cystathionine beta-lyase/cystathionine gamma-synthase|nr:aminotransferase class I/II-fold pyridoxal phosphate-dependent enzyme [Desulfovibrio sp.]
MKQDTLLAQAGARRDPATGAIAMSICPSAAFQHPALGQSTGFDYSRTGNPTRQVLEETMAALEGGARATAFASGLAAVDAVMRLFSPGDAILVTEDMYGGTFRLFERFYKSCGLRFVCADTSETSRVSDILDRQEFRGLFVELPTNPLLKVADLKALEVLAKKHGLLFIVDNTFLTPVFCRPLDFGADIAVYSATKYLGGHNDLVAGLAVARDAALGERLAYIQNAVGAILGPFESWLLLRSLKTLSLRLKKHEDNALATAEFLKGHKAVRNLRYPGLPTDPGHTRLISQSRGCGAIISFETSSRAEVERILASVRVFLFAESLGASESLITYPFVQTHADIPPDMRERSGLTDRLLRLSIGLEDKSDLIDDLARVLG